MRLILAQMVTVTALVLTVSPASPAQDMTTVKLTEFVQERIARIEVRGVVVIGTDTAQREELTGGTGTGFFISETGLMVTNAHVVSPHEGRWKANPSIVVTVNGRIKPAGTSAKATLTGLDQLSDLAVLKVDPTDLPGISTPDPLSTNLIIPALTWARETKVGEDVVAVGYAEAQEGPATISKGIVSAQGRNFPPFGYPGLVPEEFSGLIQTDATINHGNSGGPLLNMKGEVVGVNTYGFPPRLRLVGVPVVDEEGKEVKVKNDGGKETKLSVRIPLLEGSHGMNYARSRDTAQPIVDMLIKSGQVRRASLGLDFITYERRFQEGRINFFFTPGVEIKHFDMDSPLAFKGPTIGDIIYGIVALDLSGRPVNRMPIKSSTGVITCVGDLNNLLAFLSPGETVRVSYRRPDAEIEKDLARLQKEQPGADYTELLVALAREGGPLTNHVDIKLK